VTFANCLVSLLRYFDSILQASVSFGEARAVFLPGGRPEGSGNRGGSGAELHLKLRIFEPNHTVVLFTIKGNLPAQRSPPSLLP
jgi:hypothetical protein